MRWIALALALLSVACSEYIPNYLRVNLAAQTKVGLNTTPEITASQSFPALKKSIHYVVISVPSEYYEMRSVSDTQGIERSEILLKEKYSVWITEIEKMLTRSGFSVLSRQKLEEIQREQKISNLAQAASLLGADAIIQINSLDFNEKVPLDQFTDVNLKFFESDQYGRERKRVSLNEDAKNQVVPVIREDLASNPTACAAILDAKVIYAKSGEIIWFYKNTLYDSPGMAGEKEYARYYLFLLTRYGFWQQTQSLMPQPQRSTGASSEVNLQEYRGGERDQSKIVAFEMVRRIFEDFVRKFVQ